MNYVHFSTFFDKMDPKENKRLQLKYASCVYRNALSFNAMTGKDWKEFFGELRPSFTLPTREQLSNELLDETYQRVSDAAIKHIEKSNYVTLVIDGWTNVNKDAIINVVAMTPAPVFLKSIDTKGVCKNVEYMYGIVEEAIQNIGVRKVTGLISDNESKMITLKDEVQKVHKHVVFNGCVSHKLHNLIKKITALPKIRTLIDGCKEIVEVNNHQSSHAKFRKLITADKEKSFGELKLYSKTRFAGTVLMMNSVIKAQTALITLYADPANKISENFY